MDGDRDSWLVDKMRWDRMGIHTSNNTSSCSLAKYLYDFLLALHLPVFLVLFGFFGCLRVSGRMNEWWETSRVKMGHGTLGRCQTDRREGVNAKKL